MNNVIKKAVEDGIEEDYLQQKTDVNTYLGKRVATGSQNAKKEGT